MHLNIIYTKQQQQQQQKLHLYLYKCTYVRTYTIAIIIIFVRTEYKFSCTRKPGESYRYMRVERQCFRIKMRFPSLLLVFHFFFSTGNTTQS